MNNQYDIFDIPTEKTLTLLIGLPAVGKSTIAQKMLKHDPVKRRLVSSDAIRHALLDYENTKIDFDKKIEPEVWQRVRAEVERALKDPGVIECILDATNIRFAHRQEFLIIGQNLGAQTRGIVIYDTMENIKKKNEARQRTVSEDIIDMFAEYFEIPEKDEFDDLLSIGPKEQFLKEKKVMNKKDIR